MRSALALDIGATKLAACVVDEEGRASRWTAAPTRVEEGPDRILERLLALGEEALGSAEVEAVGISCGGPLDPAAGLLLGPLHLPGWDRVPVVDLVTRRFDRPAVLLNDASAGAWGEHVAGAARGSGSSVYLTVSPGVGGGAVLDGRLLMGASGNGGEFGHVLVRPGGRRCDCGRLGCMEAYAAGTQMARRAQEAVAAGERTALADCDPPTGADVARLAATDEVARDIWDDAVDALATAVVDLVNVLEPAVVVLGGGVTGAGEALMGPVRDRVAAETMPPIRAVVRVERAALGDRAPAVGAGLRALGAARG